MNTLLNIKNLELSEQMLWDEIKTEVTSTLFFNISIFCDARVSERKALISIKCDNTDIIPNDFAVSHNPDIGHYKYLHTGPGTKTTHFKINTSHNLNKIKIGVRTWWPEGEIKIKELTVTQQLHTPKAAEAADQTSKDQGSAFIEFVIPGLTEQQTKSESPLIPPLNYPVKLAPGQILRLIELPKDINSESTSIAYITNGTKAHLLLNRCNYPGNHAISFIEETIFHRHPKIEKIIIESVLLYNTKPNCTSLKEVRRSFILDLPVDFLTYSRNQISQQLRREIERAERLIIKSEGAVTISTFHKLQIDNTVLTATANFIELHLTRKSKENDASAKPIYFKASQVINQIEVYQQYGMIVSLQAGKHTIANALCLLDQDNLYYMAAAFDVNFSKVSPGSLLLYKLIELAISLKCKRIHLGGGNFGYKSRFGAKEHSLFSLDINRKVQNTLRERTIESINIGENISSIEKEINNSLSLLLGDDFEKTIGVDFEKMLDPEEMGLDRTSSRYQATMSEAFFTLMKDIPISGNDVFFDIGSGKGKILYLASRLGFQECIGIELSTQLILDAKKNLEKLNLGTRNTLLQRDASNLNPLELICGTVYYLYNPFSEAILIKFLDALIASTKLKTRAIKVIYCNARYQKPFLDRGFIAYKTYIQGVQNWRFNDSVVYEFNFQPSNSLHSIKHQVN